MNKFFRVLWCVGLLAWGMVACGSPPVSESAPSVERLQLFTHPSGVYTLRMPPSWTVGELSDDTTLLTMFAPPGVDRPLLTVYAVRLNGPLDDTGFGAAMGSYLRAPYNARLDVIDQTAMADGSWRVTGVRHVQQQAFPVNIFLQADGPYFSALEVMIPPDDPFTATLLSLVANSYMVNAGAERMAGMVGGLPSLDENFIMTGGNMTFSGMAGWTDAAGHFHLTGQVANGAPYPVEAVTVHATLYDGLGNVLEEQQREVPVPVLLDGELAPFDVVFPGGRPALAARYRLQAEARQAITLLPSYYGPGTFDWEDRAEYDDVGQLHIRGTVWNAGQGPVYGAAAVITLFDVEDRVAGYLVSDLGIAGGALAAGDSVRFDAPVPPLGAEPVRYQVALYGYSRPGGGP